MDKNTVNAAGGVALDYELAALPEARRRGG